MLQKEDILQQLHYHLPQLQERFQVRRIGLFGSYVWQDAQPGSDIDVLVELEAPTFDRYMDLKFFLEDLLHREVDLVLADTLKPRLRPIITQEVVYVP